MLIIFLYPVGIIRRCWRTARIETSTSRYSGSNL